MFFSPVLCQLHPQTQIFQIWDDAIMKHDPFIIKTPQRPGQIWNCMTEDVKKETFLDWLLLSLLLWAWWCIILVWNVCGSWWCGMCHVLVTVFPPLYRSLSKRVPVGRVRQHHSAHTLVLKKTSHLHTQGEKNLKSDGLFERTQDSFG